MSKITSKLQLTLPKALAEQFHLEPGDTVTWQAGGEVIRLIPSRATQNDQRDPKARLKLFDAATARQKRRKKPTPASSRSWSREELYDRGFSR